MGTEYAETCSGINAFAMVAAALIRMLRLMYMRFLRGEIRTLKDRLLRFSRRHIYGCGVIAQHQIAHSHRLWLRRKAFTAADIIPI